MSAGDERNSHVELIVVVSLNRVVRCYVKSYSPEVESTEAHRDGVPGVFKTDSDNVSSLFQTMRQQPVCLGAIGIDIIGGSG